MKDPIRELGFNSILIILNVLHLFDLFLFLSKFRNKFNQSHRKGSLSPSRESDGLCDFSPSTNGKRTCVITQPRCINNNNNAESNADGHRAVLHDYDRHLRDHLSHLRDHHGHCGVHVGRSVSQLGRHDGYREVAQG